VEIHNFLLQIAAIILTARVFAEIAAWLGAPSIVGELCAGIVLGPSLLGVIEPNAVINLLAEIGIILLLFEVGLETDIGRLVSSGGKAATVAVAGFIFPFILGFGLSHSVFSLPLLPALFVGGTLTATSIGITVRVLADVGRHRSNEGQVVLGAAVLDDLLGIFLLAVLYQLSTAGTVDVWSIGRIVLYVSIFFFAAPVVAKLVAPLIKHFHNRSDIPGMIPIVLVALVLIFASTAKLVGAPELLGGFVAGVALSRRFFLPFGAALHMDPEFTQHVHNEMKPIIHLFTPIFFVMVGLSLDLRAVDWSSGFIWAFSLSIAAVAILGKLGGPWVIRESVPARIAIGMAMVPRGEVGLVFAELGRVGGIFSQEVYAGMILVILYTTLASPFWIKHYYRVFGHRLPMMRE